MLLAIWAAIRPFKQTSACAKTSRLSENTRLLAALSCAQSPLMLLSMHLQTLSFFAQSWTISRESEVV